MTRSRFSLTFLETCEFLGVTRNTLSRYINAPEPTLWEGLHYTCNGKEKRFDPEKLQEWQDTPRLARKKKKLGIMRQPKGIPK